MPQGSRTGKGSKAEALDVTRKPRPEVREARSSSPAANGSRKDSAARKRSRMAPAAKAAGKKAAGKKAQPARSKAKATKQSPAGGRTDPEVSRPNLRSRRADRPGQGKGVPRAGRAPAALLGTALATEAAVLTEEEQIESAKYLPRDLPPRLFEEERFLFPETYGIDRVRLLVKDPEWIFAHWDVDLRSLAALRTELGGRMADVSRLTLRMKDPGDGAVTVTLLPPGARSWYFRVSPLRRSYHADLGFTLPSGEFRLLAESNIVVTPRVGPSSEKAARRVSYLRVRGAGSLPPGGLGTAMGFTDLSSGPGVPARVADPGAGADSQTSGVHVPGERGGASDVYRR